MSEQNMGLMDGAGAKLAKIDGSPASAEHCPKNHEQIVENQMHFADRTAKEAGAGLPARSPAQGPAPAIAGGAEPPHAQAPHGMPVWKRSLDVFCILVAAPVMLPVMFILGILIKLVSPGPVLFRQERIGYLGRRFTCFKFRTMKVNADTRVHQGHLNHLMTSNVPMKKLDASGDPRLIPFGRLLRSLGLDELPQIFNVLRGEMSLVGPRPCVPYEYACYSPHHRRRVEAVPGLTGLWQVSGKNRTTFEEMIDLDVYYARNKSLWLDIKIIFRTLPAIVSQTRDVSGDLRQGFQKTSLERQ